MAKKPAQGNTSQEPKLKTIIRKYIRYEGDLKNEIFDPKFEFGFAFTHPKGTRPDGKPKGIGFQAVKPKKEVFIELGNRLNISPQHLKILDADQKKKAKFFDTIQKIFLMKNVGYGINFKDNFRITSYRIYLNDKKKLSMNLFYETMKNLFNANIYAIQVINQICSGNSYDFDKEGVLSLYT